MNKSYAGVWARLGRNKAISVAGIMLVLSGLFCGVSLHSLGFRVVSYWLLLLNNLTVALASFSLLVSLGLFGWVIVTLSPRRVDLKLRRSAALIALVCNLCANFLFCSAAYYPLFVSAQSPGIEFAGHYYFLIFNYDDFSGDYYLYKCGTYRLYCSQVSSGSFSKTPALVAVSDQNALYVKDGDYVLGEYYP